jgi:mRNA-degrading endonuclease RelE of RelBE toxin-antitoxin system
VAGESVSHRQPFLNTVWLEDWKASYARLSSDRQKACDEATFALIKQALSPGMRVKPIQPEKYYLEARINGGDRIIFRIEGGTIFFFDIVKHDDIGRYGRRPRQAR